MTLHTSLIIILNNGEYEDEYTYLNIDCVDTSWIPKTLGKSFLNDNELELTIDMFKNNMMKFLENNSYEKLYIYGLVCQCIAEFNKPTFSIKLKTGDWW